MIQTQSIGIYVLIILPLIHQFTNIFPTGRNQLVITAVSPRLSIPTLGIMPTMCPRLLQQMQTEVKCPRVIPGAQGWACPKLILLGLLPGLFWNPMELCSLTILNLLA